MLLPLLLAAAAAANPAPATDVQPPRIEASVEIDGRLDEPVWSRAAILGNFSQFSPADGRPADDSTDGPRLVLADGDPLRHPRLRAPRRSRVHRPRHARRSRPHLQRRQRPAPPRHLRRRAAGDRLRRQPARRAGRRHAGGDGTHRAAASGTTPSRRASRSISARTSSSSRKGRLTEHGYEVEIRIPFKSLRYQPTAVQRWAINVVRQVQHSGHEDTWAPARRSGSSFLGQSGHLEGLTDLRRGLVLDLNPTVTHRTTAGRGRPPRGAPTAGRTGAGARTWAATCAGA